MDRRLIRWAILVVFCWIIPTALFAQYGETEQTCEALYRLAVDKYHNEEYGEAIQIANRIREQFPNAPAGVFALLGAYQSATINYRTKIFESHFDSLANLSIDLAQKAIKRDKRDGKNYFYLGSAYGFRSMYNAEQKKWVAAFKDGMKISKNFKLALRYSPDFYDSYYGLGLYNYWVGVKAKFLPFAGNKKEGIEQIRIAMNKGQFINYDAMFAMTRVYMNSEEFDKALELSNRLTTMFPGNPTLQYRRGVIFSSLEKWTEARASFEKLHEILQNAPYRNYGYLAESLFRMAECDYKLQNYHEAMLLCEKAIAIDARCDTSKELDGPFEKHAEIEEQLAELYEKLQAMPRPQISSKD